MSDCDQYRGANDDLYERKYLPHASKEEQLRYAGVKANRERLLKECQDREEVRFAAGFNYGK